MVNPGIELIKSGISREAPSRLRQKPKREGVWGVTGKAAITMILKVRRVIK